MDQIESQPVSKFPRWAGRGLAVLAALCLAVFAFRTGCPKTSSPGHRATQTNPEDAQAQVNELLTYALRQLNQMEEFEAGEAFTQAMDRLDQWVQVQKPPADWKFDPLAAPLFHAFSDLASKIKPIHEQLAGPRTMLELKAVARQLESIPDRLEGLSRQRDFKELESLAAHYDQVTKEIEEAVKRAGDAARQNELDERILDAYFKRLRDPRKQERLKTLIAVAQQIDDPSRLKEFLRLGEFGQHLQTLLEQPNPQEFEELVGQFEETAKRFLRGAPPTKLLIELRFALEQMADLGRMKDLVELQGLTWYLESLAGQLKATADRANREDLRDLANRFSTAGRKRDLEQLRGLKKEMAGLARPHDLEDLHAMAPQLADASARLGRLARAAEEHAKTTSLEALQLLGRYGKELAQRIDETAGQMKSFTASPGDAKGGVDKTAQQLTELTARFNELAGRVEVIHDELEQLAAAEKRQFFRRDRSSLQEAIYLRDLTRWIRGEEADDLSRARRVFDWTVRNIQLEEEPTGSGRVAIRVPQTPLETLLLGRGTSVERAWVFILLARQLGIDAALVAAEAAEGPARGALRPWAVAVLSEGELYLFEPSLGLPIPAKDGLKRAESGPLEVRPATLSAVAADDGLLRQLDAGNEHRFPIKAAEIQKVVVLLDASPSYLTERMKLVEGQLTGEDRMTLSASPSAQAERFRACKHVADVRLWAYPYETLLERAILGPDAVRWQARAQAPFQAPSLVQGRLLPVLTDEPDAPLFWEANPSPAAQQRRRERTSAERRREAPPAAPLGKGRVLHLKGKLAGEGGATHFYQMARPSDRELAAMRQYPEQTLAIFQHAKQNASYWLGLMAFEQGNYASAADYLDTRTLKASPGGPWTAGARYNLARVYEAEGQTQKAVQQYRAAADQVDGHGNLLRARWLETLARAAGEKVEPAPGKPDELPGLPGLPEPKPAQPKKPAEKQSERKPAGPKKAGPDLLPALPDLPSKR